MFLADLLPLLSRPSNEAQRKYSELHRKMEAFVQRAEETKKNPDSKYDALIHKQNCVNDTVNTQVHHRSSLHKCFQHVTFDFPNTYRQIPASFHIARSISSDSQHLSWRICREKSNRIFHISLMCACLHHINRLTLHRTHRMQSISHFSFRLSHLSPHILQAWRNHKLFTLSSLFSSPHIEIDWLT